MAERSSMSSNTSSAANVNACHRASARSRATGSSRTVSQRGGGVHASASAHSASASASRSFSRATGATTTASHCATAGSAMRCSQSASCLTHASYASSASKKVRAPPSTSRSGVTNDSISYVSVDFFGSLCRKNSNCTGNAYLSIVECHNNLNVRVAYPWCINVSISCATRRDDASANVGAYARKPARNPFVIVNPCLAASRIARNIRTGSSLRLACVGRTVRTTPSIASLIPLQKSNTSSRNGS